MNPQGSAEWKKDRAGKFTGSRFVDVLARSKKSNEPLKAYHDLVWDVVVERLSGEPVEGPLGFALQWGTDVEPFARDAYELQTGNIVAQSGFIQHPKHDFVGCSVDGLVDSEGIVEIKCPKNSAVHLQRFIDGIPAEYVPQVQGNLWVTGRAWCDFVSYDPRMPESHRILIIRVNRDEAKIAEIEAAVLQAEEYAQRLLHELIGEKAA